MALIIMRQRLFIVWMLCTLILFAVGIPVLATEPPIIDIGDTLTEVTSDTYQLTLQDDQPIIVRIDGNFGESIELYDADDTLLQDVPFGALSFVPPADGDYILVLNPTDTTEDSDDAEEENETTLLSVQEIPIINADVGETVTIDAGTNNPAWIEFETDDEQFIDVRAPYSVDIDKLRNDMSYIAFYENAGHIAEMMNGKYRIKIWSRDARFHFDDAIEVAITSPEPLRDSIAIGDTIEVTSDTLTEYTIDLEKGESIRAILETDDNLQVGVLGSDEWRGEYSGHVNSGGSGELIFVPPVDATYTLRVLDPVVGIGMDGSFTLTIEASDRRLLLAGDEPTEVTLTDEVTTFNVPGYDDETDYQFTLVLTEALTDEVSGAFINQGAIPPRTIQDVLVNAATLEDDDTYQVTVGELTYRDLQLELRYAGDAPLSVTVSLQPVATDK